MRQTKGLMIIIIILIAMINIYAVAGLGGDVTPSISVLTFSSSGIQISPNSNDWFKQNVTLNITSTDEESGISKIIYVTGGVIASYTFSGAPTTTFTTYPSISNITAEGSTSIIYYAINGVDIQESQNSKIIKIDRTKPVVNSVTLNNYTPNTGNAILVTVSATDNIGVTAVNANGVSMTYQTGNVWNGTIIAIAGTHSVNVSASDAADNFVYNETKYYTAITPDTIAPYFISFPSQKTNLTFDNLTSHGLTDVNVSTSGLTIPAGFQLAGNYYKITTTATFAGNVTVTIIYDPSKVTNENALKLLHYESGNWTDVTTSLDTANNTISGTVSSLSPFVIVEPIPPGAPCCSSGGGGGGGGGGGVSGENYFNIEIKEKYDLNIYKDRTTSYGFKNSSNPIMYVNITGNVNAGERSTSVEVLRKTSTLLNISAPDIVYKNVNIWVGTSGFASSKNIKEAVIGFKVSNSWLADNNINAGDIRLVKWDGSNWVQLETVKTMTDNTNTYYEAKTITFSNFAIKGIRAALSEVPFEMSSAETITAAPTAAQTSMPVKSEKAHAFNLVVIAGAILIVAIFIVLYMKYKKP